MNVSDDITDKLRVSRCRFPNLCAAGPDIVKLRVNRAGYSLGPLKAFEGLASRSSPLHQPAVVCLQIAADVCARRYGKQMAPDTTAQAMRLSADDDERPRVQDDEAASDGRQSRPTEREALGTANLGCSQAPLGHLAWSEVSCIKIG
jgi:hypothetical protein